MDGEIQGRGHSKEKWLLKTIEVLGAVLHFQRWLRASGYGYLEDGLDKADPGAALLEIARRAGVRGLRQNDSVVGTLPMVQDLIRLRCRPKR